MIFHKNARNLIVIYMFGFFVGNVYANLFAKDYIELIGIFSEYFFEHYILTEINHKHFLLYLFRLRVFPVIVLFGAAVTRVKKIAVLFFIVWTGFLCGIVVAASIMKMGILGSVFALVIAFPHMIFYFCAYLLLLWNICRYPKTKYDYRQMIIAFIFMCIGIVTECYVNPSLIKLFLKTV